MIGMGGVEDGIDSTASGLGGVPASELAWLLFTQTGMPGLFMLYSDLEHGKERSIFD